MLRHLRRRFAILNFIDLISQFFDKSLMVCFGSITRYRIGIRRRRVS